MLLHLLPPQEEGAGEVMRVAQPSASQSSNSRRRNGDDWEQADRDKTIGEVVVTGTQIRGVQNITVPMCATNGLRMIDGSWRIAHEHVSLPVDMATRSAVGALVLSNGINDCGSVVESKFNLMKIAEATKSFSSPM